MTLVALVLVPLAGILVGFSSRRKLPRLLLLILAAAIHLLITLSLWTVPAGERSQLDALWGHLALDPLGLVFLTTVSALFLVNAVYSLQYRRVTPPEQPSMVFLPCNLLLLSALTTITLARHLGLLWVAAGLSTLGVAPLIYLQRGRHALEATWKYIVICSVGVAFALLGVFFLGIAANDPTGAAPELFIDHLVKTASEGKLRPEWLRAAFVLMLVGYGTKAGLAPMHTWKPDAYGEAPTPVATLMATAVTACMLLCLLRAYQVCVAAGQRDFAAGLMVLIGLVSVATGAAFVVAQGDFSRLLAYSGVEHMGVMALGVGVGGIAIYGALLHMIGHSLIKGTLFFTSGNLSLAYGTRAIGQITGVQRRLPFTGVLLWTGTFATLGFPPFPMFASELTILRGALLEGSYLVASLYLIFLGIVFVAVMSLVQDMAQGKDPRPDQPPMRESPLMTLPPLALLVFALCLGLHIPAPLDQALKDSSKLLGGP